MCEAAQAVQAMLASMTGSNLLRVGIVGSIVTALCCFTPILSVLLGVIGLSAVVGMLDYVLLPALAIFVAITAYALWKRTKAASN